MPLPIADTNFNSTSNYVDEEEKPEEEEEDGYIDDYETEEETVHQVKISAAPIQRMGNINDIIQDVGLGRQEKLLKAVSLAGKKYESSLNRCTNTEFYRHPEEKLPTMNSESCLKHEVSSNSISKNCTNDMDAENIRQLSIGERHSGASLDTNADVSNNKTANAEILEHSGVAQVEVRTGNKDNESLHSDEEVKEMDLSEDDIQPRVSSLAATLTRPRSSSPGQEYLDGNKRQAVVCDFFAKGWCIKGTSCRFLHVKDHLPSKLHEADATFQGVEHKDGEGVRDGNEKLNSSSLHDVIGSTMKSFSSESILFEKHEGRKRTDQLNTKLRSAPHQEEIIFSAPSVSQPWSSSKQDSGFASSFKDVARGNLRSHWSVHHYEDPKCLYSSSFASPISGLLPSDHLLARGRELSSVPASLAQSTSSFPSLKLYSFRNIPARQIETATHDWVPSTPFRPSFFISLPSETYPRSRDSLPDGSAKTNLCDGFFKVYPYSEVASISSAPRHQIYGDSAFSVTLDPPRNKVDKYFASSHDKHIDSNNNYPSHRGELPETEAEVAESFVPDQRKREKKSEEDRIVGHIHSNEVSETNRVNRSSDAREHADEGSQKKDLRFYRGELTTDVGVDQKASSSVHMESKASKQFHIALVDFVKELLKPAWRDGSLSKDNHNLIVRKASDKVLGTIQAHQIPSTMESVQQYLSISRPKIAKLVQGYIDRLGKSLKCLLSVKVIIFRVEQAKTVYGGRKWSRKVVY